MQYDVNQNIGSEVHLKKFDNHAIHINESVY